MAIDVTYSIQVEPEHITLESNFESEELIERILAEVNAGNDWAWCTVTVVAECCGFKGKAHLGCCNYKNENDFKSDGYFEDMKTEALLDLKSELRRVVKAGKNCEELLQKLA